MVIYKPLEGGLMMALEKTKSILKTYVINICNQHLFGVYPRYRGLPIIPSDAADKELAKYDLFYEDVLRVLKEGYDCSKSRRKKGTLERCVRKGKKTLKVVVVKSVNYALDTECWLLIHVGIF